MSVNEREKILLQKPNKSSFFRRHPRPHITPAGVEGKAGLRVHRPHKSPNVRYPALTADIIAFAKAVSPSADEVGLKRIPIAPSHSCCIIFSSKEGPTFFSSL